MVDDIRNWLDELDLGKYGDVFVDNGVGLDVIGDLDDSETEVSVLIRRNKGAVLNPELGNQPKVYYLAPR